MGEFAKGVAEIVAILHNQHRGKSSDNLDSAEQTREGSIASIPVERIPGIVSEVLGRSINCYPGVPANKCYDLAVFIATYPSFLSQGRQKHLSLNEALEKLVQHMQGLCAGQTRKAVLIAWNWDTMAFAKWQANLMEIRRNANLEIYLVAGNTISEIPL